MTKKSNKFATKYDDEEPTALAFTDFKDYDYENEPTALANSDNIHTPILYGKAAERFLNHMREAEEEHEHRKKIPPTLEELKERLSFEKFILNYKEKEINELKKTIKKLEEQINGKISEQN